MTTTKIASSIPANCGTLCQPGHNVIAPKMGLGAQVVDFFRHLFSTADWPPRWRCGSWTDFHGWLYIISDLLIWASYFAIPILIFKLIKNKRDIPFKGLFLLFCSFIILCGTTHLIDAIIFWIPIYRISALVRFFTGIISVFSVYALYKVLPAAMSLRTVDELEREIAERRIIEDKLAESEFLLSEAGKMARMGGWETDLRTDVSTWSKTVYEIYEMQPGQPVIAEDVLSVFPDPYRQMIEGAVAKLTAEGSKFDLELEMTTKHGLSKWVRCYGEPLYNQLGELIKMRGVFMDIDRYKNSEINLNKSLQLLTTQNQQLKSFTHILSHNIRNHSSTINMLTSFIDAEKLDEDTADVFHKIGVVSRGLDKTLNDLADAIKIRENVLRSELLNFKAITESVVMILESDIAVNNVIIDLDFEVPTVKFPDIYLQSIIMNLISNSIKYRKATEAPLICLRTYIDDNGKKVLECIDNGLGIDLDMHGNKIFGLYKTFTNRLDAHGVGLFLVKNQVESQGGVIEVFSEPGIGTTFKITFNEKP